MKKSAGAKTKSHNLIAPNKSAKGEYTYVALCAIGAEHTLGQELKKLGIKTNGNKKGRVYFLGGEETLYQAALNLRCCDKIFLVLKEFNATDFDALFGGVSGINYEDYFFRNTKVVIDKVRIHKSTLSSQHAVQTVSQKALYEHLMSTYKMGSLPETGDEATVRIYIDCDRVEVLLDMTGDPLYKRGYKVNSGTAPLRETVAATLIQKMVWRRKSPLVDPFCGSGTILTEAMLFAYNVGAGLFRHFAFEKLKNFNKESYERVRKDSIKKIRLDVDFSIKGGDIDPGAIDCAKKNIESLVTLLGNLQKEGGLEGKLKTPTLFLCDYKDFNYDGCGTIITNPPYGERLGDEESARALYKEMKVLREKSTESTLGVLTTHKDFEDDFGEKAEKISALKAGNYDTTFFQFNKKVDKGD